ncbi:MAG: putative quinol monooxygenase [Nocardioides sp.]
MAFVVAATWVARRGEEAVVADTIRHMTPLSLAEQGCHYYQAQVSTEDPCRFLLYEQYDDAAAYDAHKASPHFQEHVVGFVLDRLEARQVTTWTTVEV